MAKFVLERHQYAPELNRIIFKNGATMKTPGATSIKEVKRLYFAKPKQYQVFGGAMFGYDSTFASLNRKYVGMVESYKNILQFVAKEKARMLPAVHTDINGNAIETKPFVKLIAFKQYV